MAGVAAVLEADAVSLRFGGVQVRFLGNVRGMDENAMKAAGTMSLQPVVTIDQPRRAGWLGW